MTSVSSSNLADKTLYRTGSNRNHLKNRVVRGGGGGGTASSRFLATISSERRRCSEPFLGSEVLSTPDSSPVDESRRKVLFLAPPTAEEAGSGGYHSDSAAVLSEKEKYGGHLKAATFERREWRVSKSSVDTTPSPSSGVPPRTTFVVHRSLSVLSATSRSSSYEEELEERVGNIRVGAQVWQQRAALERRKRLEVVEQMRAQEQSFRAMMENMCAQEEHKYERLKNRTRVLMRRCEKLRADREVAEKKLAEWKEVTSSDRKEREERVTELTEEINRLKAEREIKVSNVGDDLKQDLGSKDKEYKDDNAWCGHYEALLKIAVNRIHKLERCFTDATELANRTGDEGIAVNRSIRRKSISCPELLESVADFSTVRSTQDFSERSLNGSSITLQSNGELDEICNVDYLQLPLASARQSHENNNNQRLSNDSEVKLRQHFVTSPLVESPNQPRLAQRPVSEVFPVLQARSSTKQSNGIMSKDVNLSSSLTNVNKTFVSRSATFVALSTGKDNLSNNGLTLKPDLTQFLTPPPTPMTRVKPRRVVSMPRLDIFRRFTRHSPSVKTKLKPLSTLEPQSTFTLKSRVIYPENGIEMLEEATDNDELEEDDQLSFRSMDSKGDDYNDMSASTGSLMSLSSDGTGGDFNDSVTSRVRLPVQGQSSFTRLRDRRNGLTQGDEVGLKAAAMSRSRLDEITKNIKNYLH